MARRGRKSTNRRGRKSTNRRGRKSTNRRGRTSSRRNRGVSRRSSVRRKKLLSKQRGGNGSHRIGLELEACFKGDHEIWIHDGKKDVEEHCKGSPDDDDVQQPIKDNNELVGLFGAELKYFNAMYDDSIWCGDWSYSGAEETDPCSMELVLSEAHTFTYDDKRIYMDGEDITSNLMDEILLITSKATSCWGDSCGFHVHISETDKKYSLDRPEGKIFLLRALALWCGIEGGPPGEQTTFIEKGYIREASAYAQLMKPLDPGYFKLAYEKAKNGSLNDQELVDYILMANPMPPRFDRRYFALNIYFLGKSRATTATALDLSEPLRIEFRGHKDLMKAIMDKTEMTQYAESSKKFNPEQVALSIRFFNYLMKYLEDIDLFFTQAKTYEPNLA